MISSERVSSDLAGGSNPGAVSLSGRANPTFANAQDHDPIYYPHTLTESKSCLDLLSRPNSSSGNSAAVYYWERERPTVG